MIFKNNLCKALVLPLLFLSYQTTLFAQSAIDTLIFEEFSTEALPTGWSNIDNGTTGEIWEFNNPGGQSIGGNFDTKFAILDSENYGFLGNQNASLITPSFDLSSYTSDIKIFVKYDYEYDSNFNATSAKVEIFNGTSWVEIRSYTNLNLVNATELIEITADAAGASNAQLRMTFVGDDGYWWAIDNFIIFAQLLDADQDGITDSEDADSDNDGIPDTVEGSCTSYTLTFQDFWSALEDPVSDPPSSALDFGETSVTLERRDPQNIVAYGAGSGADPDSTGIASQNGITSYKVIQSSTTNDSSEHIFKFSKPVSDLVFGIVDVDFGPNFIDHTVVNGYAGDTIYKIKITDANAGPYATFNEGENSFTGQTATTNVDAISQVSFPVLIDSVIVIYSNKKASPTAHQAIIFNASFSFCDTKDTDGDRIADYLDLDSDDDGIPDLIEIGGVDLDGDGRVDNNTDSDQDGLAATFDTDDNDKNNFISNLLTGGTTAKNSDTDMIPDYLDLDADNDGIPDIVEVGGIDFDGDGMVDDLNGNGQLTTDEDKDGFSDWYDPDNDGTLGVDSGADGEPIAETNGSATLLHGETGENLDTDNDGLPNHLDLDSDNDGIPDLVEAGGIDTNGDGRVDVTTDDDNDGYADIYDTNDDGKVGVEDLTDALLQTGGTDTDGDKKADDTTITWNNGQGNNKDTDSDGLIDGLDLDADDDGIPDNIEAGTNDPQTNGMVNTGLAPWDADGDGLADVYDENANDGPSGGGNTNGLALVETTTDDNNDGIVNNSEAMASGGGGYNNTNLDQDKYPNHLDLDADNDGITDVVENAGGAVSADHSGGTLDGIVGDNSTVTDTNNDGWHDPSTSSTIDSDGDKLPDFLDKDADNDGIVDYLEGVCSTCPTFTDGSQVDANGNGVWDKYEVLNSSNQNGGSNIGVTPNLDDDDTVDSTPDYLDTDTDQDGQYDWTEGYDANNNGIAVDDIIAMALTYETANSNPGQYNTADADSDNIPDWLDNQPNVAGYDPDTRPPFLVEGSGHWVDTDKDGLVAIFDTDENGTAAPTPDNNGGNDNDWRDETALVVLPVELITFFIENVDCAVQIYWSTASEKDFSHFEIEKSRDGISFESMANLAGNGGNQLNNYQFIDKDIIQGENYYYRLKMVDLDASFEYSEVKNLTANCKGVDFEINLYPNPIGITTNELTLELKANDQIHYMFITDAFGKIWYEGQIDQFQQIVKIDTDHLPTGTYHILLENDGLFSAKRFIKTE